MLNVLRHARRNLRQRRGSLLGLSAAAADNDPYHLILLDWLMPGIDGIETSRRIHAAKTSAKFPPF
jgi:CheY-like chemotaxis protein